MKHIYLNLKRFDVPVEFGGVPRMEWAEGTAELLHLQSKYFTEQKKERYSFDDLW